MRQQSDRTRGKNFDGRSESTFKNNRSEYVYAESILYRFPVNLMRMQEAQQESAALRRRLDVHAQSYEVRPSASGTHSDPVGERTARVLTLEHLIERLEQSVIPVMRLRCELKNSSIEDYRVRFFIMELYYFEGVSLIDVMIHLEKRSIGYMRAQRRSLVEQLIRHVREFRSSR